MLRSFSEYINYLDKKEEKAAFCWVSNDGVVYTKTYQEYISDIHRFSNYLRESVPDPVGKHIGVLALKSYENIVCCMSILYTGAVLLLLNPNESFDKLQKQIKHADCDVIFADDFVIHETEALTKYEGKIFSFTIPSVNTEDSFCYDERNQESPMIMMYTSGTVSEGKCVVMTQKNLFSAMQFYCDMLDPLLKKIKEMDLSIFHLLPFYHVAGFLAVLVPTYKTQKINMNVNLKYLMRDLKMMPSDCTFSVPMILELWEKAIKAGRKEMLGGLALVVAGAAQINPSLIKAFLDERIDFVNAYGLTETTGVGIYNCISETGKFESIGKANHDIQVELQDGEICMKGDCIMQGYYKNEEATREALLDGWFHTGDLGYMDDEGYLYITGRKKNLIILSDGENVNPAELEALFSVNPTVKEVLVREKDKKICAEIFCNEEDQEIVRHLLLKINHSLPMYKQMNLLEFRNTPFPRTASGKIKRG